jgi:hypothetical protein
MDDISRSICVLHALHTSSHTHTHDHTLSHSLTLSHTLSLSPSLHTHQDGMRFWGSMANSWNSLLSLMVKSSDFPILAPYFVGWKMAHDDDYCKLGRHKNQWLCYFLPMTNCTGNVAVQCMPTAPAVCRTVCGSSGGRCSGHECSTMHAKECSTMHANECSTMHADSSDAVLLCRQFHCGII